MKRFLLSVFITAFAVALSLFSVKLVEEKTIVLEEAINRCYIALTEENTDYAEKALNELEDFWYKNKTSFGLFVSGKACESLQEEMKKLRLFIRNESIDYAIESIGKCRNILLSMKENEKLSIDTIL